MQALTDTCPDLPGCFSAGATLDEALEEIVEAIECHLEGMLLDGEPLPRPNTIESYRDNPDYEDGVWSLVKVDVARLT